MQRNLATAPQLLRRTESKAEEEQQTNNRQANKQSTVQKGRRTE